MNEVFFKHAWRRLAFYISKWCWITHELRSHRLSIWFTFAMFSLVVTEILHALKQKEKYSQGRISLIREFTEKLSEWSAKIGKWSANRDSRNANSNPEIFQVYSTHGTVLHTKSCVNRRTVAKDIPFSAVFGILRTTFWSVKYTKL